MASVIYSRFTTAIWINSIYKSRYFSFLTKKDSFINTTEPQLIALLWVSMNQVNNYE